MNNSQERAASQEPLGKHVIAEFYGAQHLKEPKPAEVVMRKAADEAGATLLRIDLHSFKTDAMELAGFTGAAILAESHISIHTWPESGYAAIDIFMCGDAQPSIALQILSEYFQPVSQKVIEIKRGVAEEASTQLELL